MLILKNHLLAFTDGSADNAGTKQGGYGIFLKFNDKEKSVSTSAVGVTSNNKMEIKALNNVFTTIKSSTYPLLIFIDSDYVYNCAIGKWKRKKNKEYWKEFERYSNSFKEDGGRFKLFVVESHINIQNSTAVNKGFEKFLKKNDDKNIAYLKKHSKRDLKTIFVEVLRGNHIADQNASKAKDKAVV